MIEYLVQYNREVVDGYLPDERSFSTCALPGTVVPFQKYVTDDDARYAAYSFVDTVSRRWPEVNQYPYEKPRIYKREVGEWLVEE